MDEAVTEPAEGTAVSANATVPSAPIAEYGTAKPMDLGRLKRLTAAIPDEAELHGYLHSWGVTIQAEWVADGEDGRQIMNPVILRVPFEISAGGAVTEPEWAHWFDQTADDDALHLDGTAPHA